MSRKKKKMLGKDLEMSTSKIVPCNNVTNLKVVVEGIIVVSNFGLNYFKFNRNTWISILDLNWWQIVSDRLSPAESPGWRS